MDRKIMQTANIFKAIAATRDAELFEDILSTPNVRIERIVSTGQSSPPEGWYDQDEHEWVMVLQGAAVLSFEHGEEQRLQAGDYLNIPAHCRHRVAWTDPDQPTVWLAVFYC
jgi:cupin 2 domain-containing protein